MIFRIPKHRWRWWGNAGHHICGQWCRFHLCTEIGCVVVSTLGEYVHPRHSGGNERGEARWLADNWPGEEVGADRLYETMVFRAQGHCDNPGCRCGMPGIDPNEIDMRGYNDARSATDGHREMCLKWAKRTNQRRAKKGLPHE